MEKCEFHIDKLSECVPVVLSANYTKALIGQRKFYQLIEKEEPQQCKFWMPKILQIHCFEQDLKTISNEVCKTEGAGNSTSLMHKIESEIL